MVEVAGAGGRLASMGLVSGERKGRDGTAMAATSIRGNPRRTILQGFDIFVSERIVLLIDLAHWGPGVIELSGGCEITADSDEGTDEAGEGGNPKEGKRRRVGNHPNEEAREISSSEDACTEREGQKRKRTKYEHLPATAVEVMMRRRPGAQISQWVLPKSTGRARRT